MRCLISRAFGVAGSSNTSALREHSCYHRASTVWVQHVAWTLCTCILHYHIALHGIGALHAAWALSLTICNGILLCTASVHCLLQCTASLHCVVHCIALRLRLQVRCYYWCSACNCCMGSAGQALPPIIHMNKRVIPLAQRTLHVVASYVSCTAEIFARCRVGCVWLVGLQSHHDLGRNWLAVLPQGNLAYAPVYKRIEAPQPRHAEDHWMI